MLKLKCHRDTPADGVTAISVKVELASEGKLWLRYHVDGVTDNLALADPAEPLRTDYLWHHSCFECFIAREGQSNYIEFNLCPSARWAAYQFTDYRKGAADLPLDISPTIGLDASESHFALEADIVLPEGWHDGEMLMGITTIMEEASGTMSYWALKHPPGKQEFHDRSCFIHKLTAAD